MDKIIDLALIGGLVYVGYLYLQEQGQLQPQQPQQPQQQTPLDPIIEQQRKKKIVETTKTIENLKKDIEKVQSDPATRDQTGILKRELAKQKDNYEKVSGESYDKEPPVFHTMPVKPIEQPIIPKKIYALF